MCGRATHHFTWRRIHDQLAEFVRWMDPSFAAIGGPEPNYNVAPRSSIPVLTLEDDEFAPEWMQWWLVPHWSETSDIRYATFNARAEDAPKKPAFRTAFKRGRCVVPFSGFYEWHHEDGGSKTPFYIFRADGCPMYMAAISDTWGTGDDRLDSCAILTTSANATMQAVHDRMPCVLEPDQISEWIDPDTSVDAAHELLGAAPEGTLTMHRVHSRVGNVRNNDAGLIDSF